MGKLNIVKKLEDEKAFFEMQGQIDEDVNFSAIDISLAKELVIDLSGIKSINSCGIREWIDWMGTAKSAQKIVYKKCPKIIVDQINMVAGFLPANGKVESFFVPYYSEDTGEEKSVLFSFGKEYTEQEIIPPQNIKDKNGAEMEMDVIEAKYFKFLAR